jgi:5-methylcytosine-specific restriction endonuclease McrA/ribosomal protein S14
MDDINPGENLVSLLKKLYPQNSPAFLRKMDSDLMCEGEFENIVFMSCINYIARRLITTAGYFHRKFPPTTYGPERYRSELRRHLKDYTRLKDDAIASLTRTLDECLSVSEDYPTEHEIKRIKRDARNGGRNCYICGTTLDYQSPNLWNTASIDHKWPRAMGGSSEMSNLEVACRKCNNDLKRNFVDASDFHFEEISLVSASSEEYNRKEKNRHYEVAIFVKNQYRCAVCGQPAHRVGQLHMGRIDLSDSWHFLNLTAYCSEHYPE